MVTIRIPALGVQESGESLEQAKLEALRASDKEVYFRADDFNDGDKLDVLIHIDGEGVSTKAKVVVRKPMLYINFLPRAKFPPFVEFV